MCYSRSFESLKWVKWIGSIKLVAYDLRAMRRVGPASLSRACAWLLVTLAVDWSFIETMRSPSRTPCSAALLPGFTCVHVNQSKKSIPVFLFVFRFHSIHNEIVYCIYTVYHMMPSIKACSVLLSLQCHIEHRRIDTRKLRGKRGLRCNNEQRRLRPSNYNGWLSNIRIERRWKFFSNPAIIAIIKCLEISPGKRKWVLTFSSFSSLSKCCFFFFKENKGVYSSLQGSSADLITALDAH